MGASDDRPGDDDIRVSLAGHESSVASQPIFQGGGTGSSPEEEVHGLIERCTLDEPVYDTIMRDVRSVATKLTYVVKPMSSEDRGKRLKDWDLWGPLVLCLALGVIISCQASTSEQASYAFADIFVMVWVGSGVVTLNALLLQGQVSFFQTVCVLGYCLFPLVIAAFLSMIIRVDWIKTMLVGCGLAWSARASVGFVSELVPEDKKLLGLYPVWLFYAAIAWMIMLV
eukprot:TRINITY_DN53028_c0_g1_i1.p1 TRINITY_DN53028_c0_g1~~TRINITY_DN53028_c0_g1_i1.p1  ORF type:complete len:227 (+),score=41.80 TRINITY_DN53028_c0_g1_i1:56-736(+)